MSRTRVLTMIVALITATNLLADEVVTYGPSTGSYTVTNQAGTYATTWVSTATPTVTISGTANNINVADGGFYGDTYTISASDGYFISGLSFDAVSSDGSDITITFDTGDYTVTSVQNNYDIPVTQAQSTTFQIPKVSGRYMQVSNFNISLISDPNFTPYTYVNTLTELSNNKAYVVTNRRATWYVSDPSSGLNAQTSLDRDDTMEQFAIINYEEQYYIYSVMANAFLRSDNTFGDPQPVTITSQGSDNYLWFFSFDESHNINVNASPAVVIDGWSYTDDGNLHAIIEATDFDPTTAIDMLASNTMNPQTDIADSLAVLNDEINALIVIIDNPSTYTDDQGVADNVRTNLMAIQASGYTTLDEITEARNQVRAQARIFFEGITVLEDIDVTKYYITNSTPTASFNGWNISDGATPDATNNVAEYWNKSGATITQNVTLPAGSYRLSAQAFTRTDMSALLYANTDQMNIVTVPSSELNSRAASSSWFDSGYGVNQLYFNLSESTPVTIGLKADETTGDHWLCWRSFNLERVSQTSNPQPNINTHYVYYMVDDTIWYTDSVEVGTTIVPPADTPFKDGFTFTGWNGLVDVMPDADVTAMAEFTQTKFALTWILEGGDEPFNQVDSLTFGDPITTPAVPEKVGYSVRWDNVPATMPESDIEIHGFYELRKYAITYYLDNQFLQTDSVVYQAPITPPEVNPEPNITFNGWQNLPEFMPAEDLTIYGETSATRYALTWMLEGGDEPYNKVDSLVFGAPITPPTDVPEKVGYSVRWDGLVETMPGNDIEIHGFYEPIKYGITYYLNGEYLQTDSITYQMPITPPEVNPEPNMTFNGWPNLPEYMPAEDLVIYGETSATRYALTWMLEGGDEPYNKVDSLVFGAPITPPTDVPEKVGYSVRWDGLVETMPGNDIEIHGFYEPIKYGITYYLNGEYLQTDSITYQMPITPPEVNPEPNMTFNGWPNLPEYMPAEDMTIYGYTSETLYALTWMLEGGDEPFNQVDSLTYGTPITTPIVPDKVGYSVRWDGLPATMPGNDLEIHGFYEPNRYRVNYYIDNILYQTDSVTYQMPIETPEVMPQENQTFSGWKNVPDFMPAEDIDIFGTFSATQYALTWMLEGGDEPFNHVDSLTFGDAVTIPDVPEKVGYSVRWDNVPATMPGNDLEIHGFYEPRKYSVTYYVDGNFLQTDSVTYQMPIQTPEVMPQENKTFSGWQNVPELMPAEDLNIYGYFTETLYALTWTVEGGDEPYNRVDSLAFGAPIIIPKDLPELTGHSIRWSGIPETMPGGNLEIHGILEPNKYAVNYYINGEYFQTDSATYGQPIQTIDVQPQPNMTISGWIYVPEFMPAHDVEINGSFTTTIVKLTWRVEDMEQIEVVDSLTIGATITPPTNIPEHEGYTFAWNEYPATMPASDLTVLGHYTPNSYVLRFVIDGVQIDSILVAYGSKAEPIQAPVRQGFTFNGWTGLPDSMPAHDVTVTGSYTIDEPIIRVDDVVYQYDEQSQGYQISAVVQDEDVKEVTVPLEVNGHPVVGVAEGAFAGKTDLTVLNWNSEAPVDAKCFGTPESHGNLLVFAPAGVEVSYAGNVIQDGIAANLTLYDQRPFANTQAFTAHRVTIVKEFTKSTYPGVTSGWETIVLPFDVQSIDSEEKGRIVPFGVDEGDTTNTDTPHFWLAEMTPTGFARATSIRANVPYIISLPNSERYTEEYNITGRITFTAYDVTVQPSTDAVAQDGPNFGLRPTYSGAAAADSVFVLNDEPVTIDGKTWPAGSIFVRSSRAARPFEAYTYAHASNPGNVKGYIPIDEMATGIKGINQWSMFNGQWSIANGAGAIYDLSGRKMFNGQCSMVNGKPVLRKGLYISDGQKVLVK